MLSHLITRMFYMITQKCYHKSKNKVSIKVKIWHQQLFPLKLLLYLERKMDWPEIFLVTEYVHVSSSFLDFLLVHVYPGDDDNSLVLNLEGFKTIFLLFLWCFVCLFVVFGLCFLAFGLRFFCLEVLFIQVSIL